MSVCIYSFAVLLSFALHLHSVLDSGGFKIFRHFILHIRPSSDFLRHGKTTKNKDDGVDVKVTFFTVTAHKE